MMSRTQGEGIRARNTIAVHPAAMLYRAGKMFRPHEQATAVCAVCGLTRGVEVMVRVLAPSGALRRVECMDHRSRPPQAVHRRYRKGGP